MLRTSILIILIFDSLDIHAANNFLTDISFIASRTEGVAPLAIHFDATDTKVTDPDIDAFTELVYEFNFGDQNAGIWQHSGKSKNSHSGGPLAAHVYDSPGTYTASLKVKHAGVVLSRVEREILVKSAALEFSGNRTICLSISDNMSGCPEDAKKHTSIKAWPKFKSNTRYLLKGGEDFRSLKDVHIDQVRNFFLGSYGEGASPVIQDIYLQGPSSKWSTNWIEDIRIVGLSTGSLTHSISGKDILIYKNTLNKEGSKISIGSSHAFYRDGGYYKGKIYLPKNLFVVENTAIRKDARAFGIGQQIWMGNHFDNAWEHNIRLWQVYKSVVSHNLLAGMGRNPGRPGRSNLKIHSAGLDNVSIDDPVPDAHRPASKFLVVSDNIFNSATDDGVWNTVAYSPQNSSSEEGCEDAIIENNTHVRGKWHGHWQTGFFVGRNIVQRQEKVINQANSNQLNSHSGVGDYNIPPDWDGPYKIEN